MDELTDRQRKLLRAVVEKYIETAEPVGSETIEKEAGIGVSPATIRNEMVRLTKMGFFKQPHISAGRTPTSVALKMYVEELMDEKALSVKDEVEIKEHLWDHRYNFDKLIREATRELADKTRTLAIATTDEGDVYSAGMANILDMPEFYDIDLTKAVLSVIDHFDMLNRIFSVVSNDRPVQILFGDETDMSYMDQCGFVYTHFDAGSRHQGTLAIVGPSRLNYPYVIPALRYFSSLIGEVARSW